MRRRAVLLVAAATLALACALGAVGLLSRGSGPILAVTPVPAIPSLLVADVPAGRLLAVSQFGSAFGPRGLSAQPSGSVQILDAATGKLARIVAVGQWPSVAAADPRTGRAFVLTAGAPGATQSAASPTDSNYLSVVDPRRGVILSTIALHAHAHAAAIVGGGQAPPAGGAANAVVSGGFGATNAVLVDGERGRIYVESTDFLDSRDPGIWLIALDAAHARVLRQLHLTASAGAVALDTARGHLLVSGYRGNDIAILDAASLRVLHDTPLAANARQIAVDGRTRRAFLVSEGAAPNAQATVTTLDLDGGAVLRRTLIAPNPAQVLADTATGRVFALSVGALSARAAPSTVTMLDAGSGRIIRATQVSPYALGAVLDAARGRIYVTGMGSDPASGRGNVSRIDARSGAVQRTIDLGGTPVGIAVDEQRGYVFTARVGDAAAPTDPWNRLLGRVRAIIGQAAPTATRTPRSLAPGGSVVLLEEAH